MSQLTIAQLTASAGGRQVLHGVDLEVRSGEVHAVMGPNGSGKSTLAHALMGRPGTEVTGGTVSIDGRSLLELPTWQRARAGLFLAHQHPVEVPGVGLADMVQEALVEAATESGVAGLEGKDGPEVTERSEELVAGMAAERLRTEADRIGFDRQLLGRPVNVDLSGGERKRNETVQLGALRPRFAVLDEIDSGLDVDALRAVARRLEAATDEWGLGVLAVTHFPRLLRVLRADRVHVLIDGRIVASGGPELAEKLETTGYRDVGRV